MAVVDLGIIITAINRASKTFGQVGNDLNKLEKNADGFRRKLRAIDIVLASIATGSAIALGKSIVNTAGELQAAQVRLGFFEHGLDKADKTFGRLRQQFQGAPVEMSSLLNNFSRLKAAGLDPLDGSLKAIVDAVSAFGGGTDEVNRAIIAIQQIAGKGTVQMEELRQQLGEAVPFALQIMAEKTHRTIPEFVQAVSKGMVSAREGITAFIEGAKEHFGGFTEIMAQTIVGSEAHLKNAWQGLIKRVFGGEGLDLKIGIILNEVAKQIDAIGASITSSDIEAFVEFMKDLARVALGVGEAIYRVARAVIALFQVGANMLGSLGADVLTSGIIGYFLFGRLGAVAGALIPLLDRTHNAVGKAMAGMGTAAKTFLSVFGSAAGFGLLGFFILGPAGGLLFAAVGAVVDLVLTAIRDLVRFVSHIPGLGFLKDVADKFGTAGTSVMSNAMAEAGKAVAGLSFQFEAVQTPTEAWLEDVLKLTDGSGALHDKINAMIKSMKGINAQMNDGKNNAKALQAAMKAQRQELDGQIRAQKALLDLRRISYKISDLQHSTDMPLFNSDAIDKAREAQRQYATEIEETKIKILEVRKNMIGATDDQKKIFETQIVALQQLQGQLEATSQMTTATALLMKDTWEEVGNTISDSAKTALADWAKGSLDMKQLAEDLYGRLTDLAADYLIELIKIKFMQSSFGAMMGMGGAGAGAAAGGGASTGGFLAGIASMFSGFFADGAVFPGGVRGASGIMRGPTAFGIGGETGPEAIIPLSKLNGMGGKTEITINAIDTQSAMSVLLANAGALEGALVGRRNLEKSSV